MNRIKRLLYCIWIFHGINWRFDDRKLSASIQFWKKKLK